MRIISVIFTILVLNVSLFSQTYQTIYSGNIGIDKFKSQRFDFDIRKHFMFQPFGLSGAPCVLDSQGGNTYKINPRTLAVYEPFHNFFTRLVCEDPFMENCWAEPVDIICISNADSNFIISYLQTNSQGLTGNCTSIIRVAFLSYDGGITKTGILPGLIIKAIEINPVDDNIIYVSTDNNIFKSTNRGVSFSVSANVTGLTNLLRVSPVNSSLVFASTTGGMYLSTNAGNSFSVSGITSFKDMYFDRPGPVIYGAGDGVFKSYDNGLTWIQISDINASCIEVNPDNNLIIYIGTNSGVYRSLNGGQTFNHAEINFPLSNIIKGLVKNPGSVDTIIVCTGKGIYKVWDLQTAITMTGNTMPEKYSLLQNFPNPFNPVTTITFSIKKRQNVNLIVYDLSGKEIKTLAEKEFQAGTYNVEFDASQLSSGMYIYKLITNDFTDSKRMILIK